MSEEVTLDPHDIGTFLNWIASYICYQADEERVKTKEMTSYLESAIALGLLLAEQRPELVDACAEYWRYTRQGAPDDYVNSTHMLYQKFKNRLEENE